MSISPFTRFFQSPEHQPFSLNGGSPAAVLVHGFPGSPAEMRFLGESLHKEGWSVHGVLLPGFGPDIETLAERRHTEWTAEVSRSLQQVAREHHPVLLIGFSLGAALAVQVAAAESPDGLVLLAPFYKLESLLWKALPVTRRLFPTIRPFRLFKIDFQDPEILASMERFMPATNWDDPAVQQEVRNFTLPIGMLDEIRQAGRRAFQAARKIRVPTLVIQGVYDELVPPRLTRQLVGRIPTPVQYAEVPAAHDLPDPARPGWPRVESALLIFARELVESA